MHENIPERVRFTELETINLSTSEVVYEGTQEQSIVFKEDSVFFRMQNSESCLEYKVTGKGKIVPTDSNAYRINVHPILPYSIDCNTTNTNSNNFELCVKLIDKSRFLSPMFLAVAEIDSVFELNFRKGEYEKCITLNSNLVENEKTTVEIEINSIILKDTFIEIETQIEPKTKCNLVFKNKYIMTYPSREVKNIYFKDVSRDSLAVFGPIFKEWKKFYRVERDVKDIERYILGTDDL